MCDHDHNEHSHNSNPDKNQERKGRKLKEHSAHSNDHKKWSRRSFLNTLGTMGSASLFMNQLPINALGLSAFTPFVNDCNSDRILVILRLNGGNDSLGSIIPYDQHELYYGVRPTIGVAKPDLYNLGGGYGIPNSFLNTDKSNIEAMWNEGKMSIVHSAGYDNMHASHFLGQEAWSTSSGNTINQTGWMGRYLNNQFPDYLSNLPEYPPAIHIGSSTDVMFETGQGNISYLIKNQEDLETIIESGELYDLVNLPPCLFGNELSFARTIANTTQVYTSIIKEAYDASASTSQFEYPATVNWANRTLGKKLHLLSRLIKGNLGTRVYMVDVVGFDTHVQQFGGYQHIMEDLFDSMSVFMQDLEANGFGDKVLTFTISEFGRTVGENSGGGTDHGGGGAMMMWGGGLDSAGFHGTAPDLSSLINPGDTTADFSLPPTSDYRSVYRSILDDWLCVDNSLLDQFMTGSFANINGLIVPCSVVGAGMPCFEGYNLELKVFLEGPYTGAASMQSPLNELIPTFQPYSAAPFNYQGTETIGSVAENMVDWVLVEARSGNPNVSGDRATVTIETKAAILYEDGTILGPNGIPLRFTNLEDGNAYYFCIRHRNHLDILSSVALIAESQMSFDFTTSINQAFGPDQLKISSDNKAMMFAGDFNKDGIIQNTDGDAWQADPAQLYTYNDLDANLDGTVQVTDYDKWRMNRSKIGVAEIQFD